MRRVVSQAMDTIIKAETIEQIYACLDLDQNGSKDYLRGGMVGKVNGEGSVNRTYSLLRCLRLLHFLPRADLIHLLHLSLSYWLIPL